MIKLHRKLEALPQAGQKVSWEPTWFNARAIIYITQHPDTGETWLNLGPTSHKVKESPEEVLFLIEKEMEDWALLRQQEDVP